MATHSPVSSTERDRGSRSSWCTTEFCVTKIYFNWKIKNFLLCRYQNGEALTSSTFAAPCNKSEWCLRIYLNDCKKEKEGYVSLYLNLISSVEDNVTASFKFYLYDQHMERRNERTVNEPKKFPRGGLSGVTHFVEREYLLDKDKGLLSGSDLDIGCEVYVTQPPVVTSGVSDSKPPGVVECDLSRNLGDLFRSEKYSNLVLSVNGKKFNCHKAILAARSPVFSAMFEYEMREKNKGEVLITDVDEETMGVFLEYIYTGKVENVDKFAPDLLVLSDKYDIPRLKSICREHLFSTLSPETAVDILSLADKHDAEGLKKSAIVYFVSEAKTIKNTTKWESLSDQHPDLLKELIDAFAEL